MVPSTGAGEMFFIEAQRYFPAWRINLPDFISRFSREPEIQNFGGATRRDKNIGRFEIPMNNARGMGGLQSIGDLHTELQQGVERQRFAGDAFSEGLAFEQFHGDKIVAVKFTDVMNGAYIRMV